MEKWIDLTVLIDDDFIPYPGDKKIEFTKVKTIENDGYNMHMITTGMHMGTHIDSKNHVTDSSDGIEGLNINDLIGKARVVRPEIINGVIKTESIFSSDLIKEKILILDLKHSSKLNTEEYYKYPKFSRDIIKYLLKYQIKVIAFDMPSPEYENGDFLDMHRDLLKYDIVIVENLTNLSKLNNLVDFIALPLKIKGLDGSMTRCVAKNI